MVRYMVTLLQRMDMFTTNGLPVQFEPGTGIVGFLPVFDDYEKAKAWAGSRGEVKTIHDVEKEVLAATPDPSAAEKGGG